MCFFSRLGTDEVDKNPMSFRWVRKQAATPIEERQWNFSMLTAFLLSHWSRPAPSQRLVRMKTFSLHWLLLYGICSRRLVGRCAIETSKGPPRNPCGHGLRER